jgi:cephalosporin-C deacetylase
MRLVDEQVQSLLKLNVPQTRQPDFDSFWAATMEKVRTRPLNARLKPVDHPIKAMDVRDLVYEGLDGTDVHAWLLLPRQRAGKVPCLVFYHGANGWRGFPANHAQWLMMGIAIVAADFRLQFGLTGSKSPILDGVPGALSFSNITHRDESYYFHTWTDQLRAIEVALAAPEIDSTRIGVIGGSQGGGMALGAAALHPAVKLCVADVPANCWLEKRIFDKLGYTQSIGEITHMHGKLDQALEAASYFDNLNLADRIRCPVLASVGLKDPVCPPMNCYAALNKITAPKEIVPYPFGDHAGGGSLHNDRKLEFVAKHFLS